MCAEKLAEKSKKEGKGDDKLQTRSLKNLKPRFLTFALTKTLRNI